MEKQKTFCRICEAQCGVIVSKADDRIIKIEPNPDHVASTGYACIKGLKMGNFAHSPDRLTTPLKKVGNRFEPISWNQALTEIAAKLNAIHSVHGGEAIAAYAGNPISFSLWPVTVLTGFLKAFGADKLFTPGTQDCANKFAGAERLFGSPNEQVFPDIDHCKVLIAIGSNPVISKMSFISLPHPMERIEAIKKRGGKIYWVNPRRTESAKRVGEHIAIRPDTDVFLMLGFLHEVIQCDGVDHDRVARHMEGYEALARVADPWTPERVAQVTGIQARVLRELVATYLAADGAALYSSTGVNQGSHGLLVYWLQEAINAITGNLDKRGGVLAGMEVMPRPTPATETPRSRIENIPYVNSTIPAGIMADEILSPGKGKVRAMFNMAGNPLLTCAGSDRLARAFDDLELFVCMDIVRNETAEYADYILPGLHGLERADIPFYFFTVMGLMPTRHFIYTDPVVPAPGECRDEGLVFRQLCRVAKKPLAQSRPLQWLSNIGERLAELPFPGNGKTLDTLFLSLVARSAKIGGLRKLRKHPDGILLEPNQPGNYLGKRVATKSGKVQLAPPDLLERAATLEAIFEREIADSAKLKLIQKRERFSHNSWAHNVEEFIQGDRSTNYLYIHPTDAARLGLENGSLARASANDHWIDVPVRIDRDMTAGSVAIPHGWGHQRATGLSTAQHTTGVNVNIIMPDGAASMEPISGMSHMNGVIVDISPAPCENAAETTA